MTKLTQNINFTKLSSANRLFLQLFITLLSHLLVIFVSVSIVGENLRGLRDYLKHKIRTQDTSGVIFEVVEHDYFNITDLGMWDQMMPGMINVSSFRHLFRQSRLLLRSEFLECFLCRVFH